jgi:pimeloyl-ACP methyl ester carboxylesterase
MVMTAQPNIVLVHGAWADGSCWSAVIERLQANGYNVTAPQFPVSSLAADVARLRQVGFAWLPEDDFVNYFAADVDRAKARVIYAVQQPLAASTLQDVMGVPAWKSQPSWFLVAENDQAIPPDAERLFAKRMQALCSGDVACQQHPHVAMALHAGSRQARLASLDTVGASSRNRQNVPCRNCRRPGSAEFTHARASAGLPVGC